MSRAKRGTFGILLWRRLWNQSIIQYFGWCWSFITRLISAFKMHTFSLQLHSNKYSWFAYSRTITNSSERNISPTRWQQLFVYRFFFCFYAIYTQRHHNNFCFVCEVEAVLFMLFSNMHFEYLLVDMWRDVAMRNFKFASNFEQLHHNLFIYEINWYFMSLEMFFN
jgi:hypothetical protein